jgi:hypothetical protein
MEDIRFDATQPKRPGLIVLTAGVATAIGSLGLLFILGIVFPDFTLMGFYLEYVIPLGAILVGLVAGSGYGIASWVTGCKISRGLLLSVIVLQVAVYFLAQYVEFTMLRVALGGELKVSFWQYFDFMTRSFCWEENGQPGEPFGAWGYGMRALEIGGFALGGIVAPAILFAVPYCDKCQVYMRSKELGLLPAGVVPKKIKKKETEAQQAYEQEIGEALQRGHDLVKQMTEMISSGQADAFAGVLGEHAPNKKQIGNLTSRITVKLHYCRRCGSGNVIFQLASGQGENIAISEIGKCEADSAFLQNLELYSRQR